MTKTAALFKQAQNIGLIGHENCNMALETSMSDMILADDLVLTLTERMRFNVFQRNSTVNDCLTYLGKDDFIS